MTNFTVINENYEFKDGDVIAVFKINDSEKTYVMYSVDDFEKDESKIMVSYLEKDSNNNDIIVKIHDINERKRIIGIIKEIIKGVGNNE